MANCALHQKCPCQYSQIYTKTALAYALTVHSLFAKFFLANIAYTCMVCQNFPYAVLHIASYTPWIFVVNFKLLCDNHYIYIDCDFYGFMDDCFAFIVASQVGYKS